MRFVTPVLLGCLVLFMLSKIKVFLQSGGEGGQETDGVKDKVQTCEVVFLLQRVYAEEAC